MASPPRLSPATSPPHPYHTSLPSSNPKKRPSLSLSGGAGGPIPRRRKTGPTPASTPNTSHPLRQTSFPPEESAIDDSTALRSPSVESDITGITGLTGGDRASKAGGPATGGKGPPKKRKYKRRGTAAAAAEPSIRSSPAREASLRANSAPTAADNDDGDFDEDDDEDDDNLQDALNNNNTTTQDLDLDREASKRKLAILIEAFDPQQSDRYDLFRRTKLREGTLRRIVNQLLSQSVPPQVIKTVNGYTKVFLGELVERARDVRGDRGEKKGREGAIGMGYGHGGGAAASMMAAGQEGDGVGQLPTPGNTQPRDGHDDNTLDAPAREPSPLEEEQSLGPLTPDDFREALRRYRKSGEGAGTGLQGLSLPLGVGGKGAARLGGRRLLG